MFPLFKGIDLGSHPGVGKKDFCPRREDNEHRMHWVSWEKMTQAKEHGRLGFRDLHSFNLAILPHQAWRLLQAPGSPWELFGEWAGQKHQNLDGSVDSVDRLETCDCSRQSPPNTSIRAY